MFNATQTIEIEQASFLNQHHFKHQFLKHLNFKVKISLKTSYKNKTSISGFIQQDIYHISIFIQIFTILTVQNTLCLQANYIPNK